LRLGVLLNIQNSWAGSISVIVGGVTRLRDAAYLGGWAYRRARFRSKNGDRKPILERNRTAACERAPRLGFTAAGQYRYVRLGAR